MNGTDQIGSAVGKGGPAFTTTHWSVVLAADRNSPGSSGALATLCRAYWRPLYAFVRRRGHGEQDAQDLTQEFFKRFLENNYVAQADRERGRFRSFLLASMQHFLANQWDQAHAAKRGGGRLFISLDEFEREPEAVIDSDLPPDRLYDRRWALTVLDQAFARLREECVAAGKAESFEVLRVYLSGEKASTSYAEAGARLQMSPGAVQVAVHRLRGRYGELLRREIAHTVGRPEEIDEELRHLFAALRS